MLQFPTLVKAVRIEAEHNDSILNTEADEDKKYIYNNYSYYSP